MKAVIVFNASSGNAMSIHDLKKCFLNAGIEVVSAIALSPKLNKALRPYLKKKDVIIAAYGGDGTLSSVADILVGSRIVFAPLSGGTLNHFTKDLGVAQDINEALHNLTTHRPKSIDVACVNGRVFINNSSIGLYPSILHMRDDMKDKVGSKWVAAFVSCIKAFVRYRNYKIEINGEHFVTPFLFVGNNNYQLEKHIAGNRQALNEGVLSVYGVVNASRWSMLRVFTLAIFSKLHTADEVKIWKTKELTVYTKAQKIRISRDGEHETIQTPLHYNVIAGGLNVLF